MTTRRILFLIFICLAPFCCFLVGYLIPSYIFTQKTFTCPSFIGERIQDAAAPISSYPLNIRIVSEQVHNELPSGTILHQKPLPGQKIKAYQSMYLVLSKKDELPRMPVFDRVLVEDASAELQKNHIQLIQYSLPSSLPKGSVLALFPRSGALVRDQKAHAYVSAGEQTLRIVPNFVGGTLAQAHNALAVYDIEIKVLNNQRETMQRVENEFIIHEQRPLAGSFVDIAKPFTLYVS